MDIVIITGAPCSGKSTTSAAIRAVVIHIDAYLEDQSITESFKEDLEALIVSGVKAVVIDVDAKRFLEVESILSELTADHSLNLMTAVLKPSFNKVMGIKCREGKVMYPDSASEAEYDAWYNAYPDNAAVFKTHSGAKKAIIDTLRKGV